MSFSSVDEFKSHIASVMSDPDWRPPAAFGLGIATMSGTKTLDTAFVSLNLDENIGFAALLSELTATQSTAGTVRVTQAQLSEAMGMVAPMLEDGGQHPNARLLEPLCAIDQQVVSEFGTHRIVVFSRLNSLEDAPIDTSEAYLRLHLLSARKVLPNAVNLDGIFGLLNNVVWTNLGPADPETFEASRTALRMRHVQVQVFGIDKFPRMTDYVIPAGVRIADADRVRLGAYIGDGTTVMHEGFVNFNAGTLGTAMIEGRISQGVIVGEDTDLGGSASVLGTLSGGGKHKVVIGQRCLLGANSGLGISLGDDCVVEAGLYVTAGTVVTLPDGTTKKARELSGASNMLLRRNSTTGRVELIPNNADWDGLNAQLHSNL